MLVYYKGVDKPALSLSTVLCESVFHCETGNDVNLEHS